jgi:hypothetical protein
MTSLEIKSKLVQEDIVVPSVQAVYFDGGNSKSMHRFKA